MTSLGQRQEDGALYFLVGILGHTRDLCERRIPRVVQLVAQAYDGFSEWALRNKPLRIIITLLTGIFSMLAYFSSRNLTRRIADRVKAVQSLGGAQSKRLLSYRMLEGLPEPAQRYLRYALQEGQPFLRCCALRQAGLYRLRASPGMRREEGWGQVKASQFFSTTEPGYVWAAVVKFAPFMWVRGWDSYIRGKGQMFFQLFNMYTMISDTGRAIDNWGLYRYLSEAVYFPTALLPSDHVRWEPVDKDSARCVLTHGQASVSAVFHVTKTGAIDAMWTPKRIRCLKEDLTMETGHTWRWSDWQERDGIHVPLRVEMAWNLEGNLTLAYAKLVTTDITWSASDLRTWEM